MIFNDNGKFGGGGGGGGEGPLPSMIVHTYRYKMKLIKYSYMKNILKYMTSSNEEGVLGPHGGSKK